MIHEAYMHVYIGSRFSLRVYGRAGGSTRGSTRGPCGPKKLPKLLQGGGGNLGNVQKKWDSFPNDSDAGSDEKMK